MNDGIVIALITAAGVILAPTLVAIVSDGLKARRERIEARTKHREAESRGVVTAMQDALDAKNNELADMRAERNWWRDRAIHLDDGWYGQRRER